MRTLLKQMANRVHLAMLLGVAVCSGAAAAPTTYSIRAVNTPLTAWVAARPHASPDTLPAFETPAPRISQFRDLLQSLLDRKWAKASAQARAMNYLLVRIREAGSTFIVASDDSDTGRDPTVVINLNPKRDLVVGAPHVPFEQGTAEQATVLLRDLAGRAAIVSGAHRCASRSFTRCDGRTDVCGTLQSFRDSDVGHNVATLYHAAHVLFAERWRSSIVMSLHGMSEDDEGVRTSLIVSNGIRAGDPAQRTVATRLRARLTRWIMQPGAVVSCNLAADSVHDYRKLCGLTNVQGRHVNGDSNACRGDVDAGTGRFIHLEQDPAVRQPYTEKSAQIKGQRFHIALTRGLAMVLPRARAR